LFDIPRVFGGVEDFFREVKAEPCAPGPDFRAGTGHATGEVLEMADRISKIAALLSGGGFENPDEGAVG
jgi:hypothetical protein